MKPVFQDKFGPGSATDEGGNCFSAVLASLLELELSEVPHFYAYVDETPSHDKWWMITDWLRERHHGIIAFDIENNPEHAIRTIGPYVTVIGSGISPRFPGVMHAVIGFLDKEGKWTTTHDPHPEGTGLVGEPSMVEWVFKRLDA